MPDASLRVVDPPASCTFALAAGANASSAATIAPRASMLIRLTSYLRNRLPFRGVFGPRHGRRLGNRATRAARSPRDGGRESVHPRDGARAVAGGAPFRARPSEPRPGGDRGGAWRVRADRARLSHQRPRRPRPGRGRPPAGLPRGLAARARLRPGARERAHLDHDHRPQPRCRRAAPARARAARPGLEHDARAHRRRRPRALAGRARRALAGRAHAHRACARRRPSCCGCASTTG